MLQAPEAQLNIGYSMHLESRFKALCKADSCMLHSDIRQVLTKVVQPSFIITILT